MCILYKLPRSFLVIYSKLNLQKIVNLFCSKRTYSNEHKSEGSFCLTFFYIPLTLFYSLLLGDVPLQYHIIGQAHGAYFVQQARIVAVPAGGLIQTHPAGHLLRQLRSLLAVEVDLGDLGAEGAV